MLSVCIAAAVWIRENAHNDGRLNAEHADDAETARSLYLLFSNKAPIGDCCIPSGSEQRIPALVLGARPPLGTIRSIRQFPEHPYQSRSAPAEVGLSFLSCPPILKGYAEL